MYGQEMNFSNWLCGGGGMISGPMGMIMMFVFWAIVISLVVQLVRSLFFSNKTTGNKNNLDAKEVLNKRYANGDISRDEFHQMKKDIS